MNQTEYLRADQAVFRANVDGTPFTFTHTVAAGNPLLQLLRLSQLAQFLKRDPDCVYFDAGDIRVEQRWNQRPRTHYTLDEVLSGIESSSAWIILKHAEKDPEYRQLMEAAVSDLEALSGRRLREIAKNWETQIMLSSPGRVTPYHFDNECNFLLQIRGEKDIYIFDQTDRTVLTDVALERFWMGDWNAGEYQVLSQDGASRFRLAPGNGVHIPVNAPHWVKNDENVSISLSINFEWKDELRFNVYRANVVLRRLGIEPAPPGVRPFRDKLKNVVIGLGFMPVKNAARSTVRFLRRLRFALHESRRTKKVNIPGRSM